MQTYLTIMKALSDANRVRMLFALREGELCVCQLIDLLQLAPSTVSKHLSLLVQAGLADNRKDGRWVHYRLPPANAKTIAARMARETFRAIENTDTITRDKRKLQHIRRTPLEDICRTIMQDR
jgi:ArsR family transcriptional regulator